MWNLKASSKICQERDQVSSQTKHLQKLSSIKPSINTNAPYQPSFMRTRAKQRKTQQEKNDKIKKENKILLEKMFQIEKKKGPMNQNTLVKFYRPNFVHGNTVLRANQQKKINTENHAFLDRLTGAQPYYNKKYMDDDYQKNVEYRENIIQNARRSQSNLAFYDNTKLNSQQKSQRPPLSQSNGFQQKSFNNFGMSEQKSSNNFYNNKNYNSRPQTSTQTRLKLRQNRPMSSTNFNRSAKQLV